MVHSGTSGSCMTETEDIEGAMQGKGGNAGPGVFGKTSGSKMAAGGGGQSVSIGGWDAGRG